MRFRSLFNFACAAVVVAALAAASAAQTVQATGTVKLVQADGTAAPVEGATVKFFRTDIKQEFTVKTDKKGHYVHAGIPLVGTFTIAVSAPGAAPTFLSGVRIGNSPNNDVTLMPGDGRALTLEETKAAGTGTGAARAGAAAGAAPSAEDKKKAAEIAAERARVETENKRIAELNTRLPEIIKAGNEAFVAKRYDEAITRYDEGISADPTQSVFYRNKAVAMRARAVDKYNAAIKVKPTDKAGLDAARADLKGAVESAEKAFTTYQENKSKNAGPAGAGAPGGGGASPELDYLSTRAETYRLALQTNTEVNNEQAAKAIEEYINAEPDQTKKDAAQAGLGDALRFAMRYDESIAKFREVLAKNPNNADAIFGLGIALASKAGEDVNMVKEAHDALAQYVAKAPEGTRKQEAAEMVKYLDETLKAAAAQGKTPDKPTPARRRRP
jgi:tetratricopeptide (TPR) repeat protein